MENAVVRMSVQVKELSRVSHYEHGTPLFGWRYTDGIYSWGDIYNPWEELPKANPELIAWASGKYAERHVRKLMRQARAWYSRKRREEK